MNFYSMKKFVNKNWELLILILFLIIGFGLYGMTSVFGLLLLMATLFLILLMKILYKIIYHIVRKKYIKMKEQEKRIETEHEKLRKGFQDLLKQAKK